MNQPSMVPQSLVKTLVCFYIELVLDIFALLAVSFFIAVGAIVSFSRYTGPTDSDLGALLVLCILFIWWLTWLIFKGIVVVQLRQQKRWAWVAAIVISVFNLLSFPYIIFGIINLIGLLNSTVTAWFKSRPLEPHNGNLRLAIISLRITAVIYWVLGLVCFFLPFYFIIAYATTGYVPPDFDTNSPATDLVFLTMLSWFAALWGIGPGIFFEYVIRALKRTQYWAWIAGIIIFGIYIPSGFILFGVLGLVGLLNKQVIESFNTARSSSL